MVLMKNENKTVYFDDNICQCYDSFFIFVLCCVENERVATWRMYLKRL